MKRIYFDHNATTPIHPEILERSGQWLKSWGNASSIHQSGREPKTIIREARKNFSDLIHVNQLEVIFTAGGSESNNFAIKGIFFQNNKSTAIAKNHYLVSTVEHPSVLETFEFLKRQGADVEYIDVNKFGEIDLEKFERQVRSDTALVSCMLANNETGHVFPIRKMAKIAHEKGALFHTDAVQALGKMSLNISELEVDLASFSGHKFYALKGVGVLYVRTGVRLENLIHGGGQERNRRAGTENTLSIASLGYMCGKKDEVSVHYKNVEQLRNYLESEVVKIPGIEVHGTGQKRLPNTTNLRIEGCDGETMLMNLDLEGFSVSTGAACSSGSNEPSPVLRAMGWSRLEAQNSLRISLGWENTKEEVDFFLETLNKVTQRVRLLSKADEQ